MIKNVGRLSFTLLFSLSYFEDKILAAISMLLKSDITTYNNYTSLTGQTDGIFNENKKINRRLLAVLTSKIRQQ